MFFEGLGFVFVLFSDIRVLKKWFWGCNWSGKEWFFGGCLNVDRWFVCTEDFEG